MNLLKDLKTLINRRKGGNSETVKTEEIEEDAVANVSMKDGDHGTIFGINRKIVIGIGIFFVTVFCVAFIFSMDNDKSNKKDLNSQLNQKQEIAPNTINRGNNANLPNNYESLAAMDKKNSNKSKSQAGTQQAVTQQPVQANTRTNTSYNDRNNAQMSDVEAILSRIENNRTGNSYSKPYSLGSEVDKSNSAEKTTVTTIGSLEDKFKSAIAFSIGNSNNMSAEQTATDKSENSSVAANSYSSRSNVANTSYNAPSTNMIVTGSLIPVMLLTGINTDTEGHVIAMVQSDIYDSVSGTNLIIPAGSRVVGTYSKSNNGRIAITFNSLVLADGGTWSIEDSFVAVDGAGYTGIQGKVNRHTNRIISSGMFGSAIAALGSLAAGNTSSADTYTAGQLASQGAMSNLINMTSEMMKKNADIAETVTVEPGYYFNIYVTKSITICDVKPLASAMGIQGTSTEFA